MLASIGEADYEKLEVELVKLEDSISRYPDDFRVWRRSSMFHLANYEPDAAFLACQRGIKKFGTIVLAPLIELSCLFALMSDYSRAIGIQLLALDYVNAGEAESFPEWRMDEFSQLTEVNGRNDSGNVDFMCWKELDEYRRLCENGSEDQR